MRGFGFPGWALAVTVPTSTKPKPSAAQAGRATPFLSKPAARPTGLGKARPKTVLGLGGGLKRSRIRSADASEEAARRLRIARLCAASADRENRIGLTKRS